MNRRKTAPPRGVLKSSAAADPTRYQHARYHPSPDLATLVEHFWSVQWDLRGLAPERAETLPHPSVHMIFERHVGARIAGVARKKFTRVLQDEGGVIAAKFTPGGFYPFVGEPISRFTDAVVPLRDVFGAEADVLEREVLAEPADPSSIAIIEAFLRKRLPPPDLQALRIAEIVLCRSGRPGRPESRGSGGSLPVEQANPATAVREVRRRQPQMGHSTLPSARSGGAAGVGRLCPSVGAGGRPRLQRPGALRARLQGAGRDLACGVRQAGAAFRKQRV